MFLIHFQVKGVAGDKTCWLQFRGKKHIKRAFGLVVWFLLWVQEVPSSILGMPQICLFYQFDRFQMTTTILIFWAEYPTRKLWYEIRIYSKILISDKIPWQIIFFFKVNIRDWKQGGQAKEIPASSILKFKHSVLLPSVYTSSNWSKEWKTTFRSYSLFNIPGKWHKKLHSNPRDQKLLNHKKRIHFKFIRNFMQRKLENQPRQLGIWSSGMILA